MGRHPKPIAIARLPPICYNAPMKAKLIPLLCSALLTCAASADSVTNEIETTARCSLIDGSLIIGKPDLASFPFGSAFGDISVPLASLDSLDVEKKQDRTDPSNVVDRISTVLHLKNGDRLTTTPGFADFGLQTSFGAVTLGLPTLRSVAFSHRKLSNNTDGLVFHCTFDSPEAIEHPAVGPSGHFDAGEFVAGRVGQALRVPAKVVSTRFEIPALSEMTAGGCIEFWARIENERNYCTDGGDPRFFQIDFPDKVQILLQFVSNEGHGLSGLSFYGATYLASVQGCSAFEYQSILPGSAMDWHHYAIIWDEKGIDGNDDSFISIRIDGKPVKMFGKNTPDVARRLANCFSTETSHLGFPRNPERSSDFNAKSPYLIDEFKIWNFPKTDF